MRTLLLIAVLVLPAVAQAGPDWQTIEYARSAKQAEQAEAATQQTRQQQALQKLQAACDKVRDDAEVQAACEEMIAAVRALD